jgi:hypothetical protein
LVIKCDTVAVAAENAAVRVRFYILFLKQKGDQLVAVGAVFTLGPTLR